MTAHERILEALIKRMLAASLLEEGEILEMADELQGADADAAHLLRCFAIEVAMPSESEWRAGKARARFRVIEGNGE